jgi:hypothetical protein
MRLVEVLHPEVGAARLSAYHVIRGAAEVGACALTFASLSPFVQPALVNGVAGVPRRSSWQAVLGDSFHRLRRQGCRH